MFSLYPRFLIQINHFILVLLIVFISTVSFYDIEVLYGAFLSASLLVFIYYYCIHINDKRDYVLLLLMQLLIFVRVALAYYDAQISVLPGMNKDPLMFYAESMHYLKEGHDFPFLNGSASFKLFLGFVYTLLGENRFSGNIVSVCASSLALILFYECLLVLRIKYMKALLVIFGVHFSFLLYSVVTIREAYLTAFVLLFTYLSLSAFLNKKHSLVYFSLAMFSLIIWPIFHVKAFYLYSVVTSIVFTCLFVFFKRVELRPQKKQVLIILLILLPLIFLFKGNEFVKIVKGESPYSSVSSPNSYAALLGLNRYLRSSQEGAEARTKFKTVLDTSSASGFVKTAPISFYYYMSEPMPWNYRGDLRDLMPMAESVFRVIALFLVGLYLLSLLFSTKKEARNKRGSTTEYTVLLIYVFILYLAQCGIWSLGTANYGQSFRHHVSSLPLLIICLGIVITSLSIKLRLSSGIDENAS